MKISMEYYRMRVFSSRIAIMLLAVLLVLAIGLINYAIGYNLASFVFYLIPIIVAAWFAGLYESILISLLSALSWMVANHFAGKLSPDTFVLVWNVSAGLLNFIFFAIAIHLLRQVREYRRRDKEALEFIVHDLRTPLSTISLSLNNVTSGGVGALSDGQKRSLINANASVERTFSLVNSILDIARLHAGKMDVKPGEINIEEFIDLTLRELSSFAEKKHVSLEKDIDIRAKRLRSDAILLGRVLTNLLSNAIKASPPESAVRVGVKVLPRSSILFEVTDKGSGISKDIINKIFDRFARIKGEGPELMMGSIGLGLTFCKLAVEELGGNICIDSAEGKGTKAGFILPESGPSHKSTP